MEDGMDKIEGRLLTDEEAYLTEYIFQYLDRSTLAYNKGGLSNQDRAKYIMDMVRGSYKIDAKTASIKDAECQARIEALIEDLRYEIMEYFRNYVRQWEKKGIEPTFGCIWDMLRCAGKEDFKGTRLKGGEG